MSELLATLNEQQRQAVAAPDGPVLILAGPGSGKTRVLTYRIAYLAHERQIAPTRIAAVTFTNKAAREMRERAERVLGDSVQGITLGTFHGVCARWLRIEAGRGDLLPVDREFVIFDADDQLKLMKYVIGDVLNLDEKLNNPSRILNAISAAKNDLITPATFQPGNYREEVIRRVYEAYQEQLALNNAVDFDDLLLLPVQMLRSSAELLEKYRRIYQHILVDEFQDTNAAQYELIRLLAGDSNSLFVVGDEDQSIYRWRGADYRNMARLRKDYPALYTVLLEQNYRSTQSILDAARAVIDRNKARTPKALFTENGQGVPLVLSEAHNEAEEAQYVVDRIATLVAAREVEPGQCAVMYRTNAQSRTIEEAFLRANLPYRIVGAQRFYGRREVKDLIAYLRIIHNPADLVSLTRVINVPPRGIGDKTVSSMLAMSAEQGVSVDYILQQVADGDYPELIKGRSRAALSAFAGLLRGWRSVKDRMSIPDLLRLVIDETAYRQYLDDGTPQGEERVDNVNELVNLAVENEELPLASFLENVSLIADADTIAEGVNAPTLLTLHAAKGLEYDVVFLVGLEEDILPHSRALETHDPEDLAEERRLFYVGITRARKQVYLLYTFARSMYGGRSSSTPSRFLKDIPRELLRMAPGQVYGLAQRSRVNEAMRFNPGPPRIESRPTPEPRAGSGPTPVRTGQRVSHPKFGEGIVIEVKPSAGDFEVSVVFESVGIKRLLAAYANLTPIEG